MAIRFTCRGCGKTIAAPEEKAGKIGKCPGCGSINPIPQPPPPPPDVVDEWLNAPGPPPPATASVTPPPAVTPPRQTAAADQGVNAARVGLLVAAVAGMIGVFLPWASMPMLGSINGMVGMDGKLTLGLFAVPFVLGLANIRQPIGAAPYVASAVCGLLAGGVAAWKIATFGGEATGNELADAMVKGTSIGVGLFVIVLAGLAVVVVPFVLSPKKSSVS